MVKVLIVDDTKAVHAFIKASLADKSYHFEHAFDGSEAVEKFKQGEEFDLVLLDWEMPIMTGPETLKSIRELGKNVPIIMVTSVNGVANVSEALQAGAQEYVMKPFTKEILNEKIDVVMNGDI